jgi:flagellar protein FlaG
MSLDIGRLPSTHYLSPPVLAPPRAAVQPPPRADLTPANRFDTVVDEIPPAPTEEVRAHVDRAAQIVHDMTERNRELHFTKDEETGRVIIQVRDLQGTVIRTIPPSHALDIMSGASH